MNVIGIGITLQVRYDDEVLEPYTARRYPNLFAHWRFGVKPDGWTMGAV